MVRVIVGLEAGHEPGHASDALIDGRSDPVRVLDLGDAGAVDLVPQGVELDDVRWYWVDLGDDQAVDPVVAALRATPGVSAAFVQPPEGPPG